MGLSLLTYSFENIGSDFLYEHLYKCIKQDILDGKLTAETKLPSKRNFAKQLGISVITIENAYQQLMAEGYLYSLPKKGFFVSDLALSLNKGVQSQNVNLANPSATKNNKVSTIKQINQTLPVSSNDIANFTYNQIDTSQFPFTIWAKILRDTINDKQEELITASPYGGIKPLREAICNHLQEFRDMHVLPEQIIVGAGTEYLYTLLIQLLGMNLTYAVEDPGYNKIAHIYEKHNITCKHIPMDENGISVNALNKSGASILHISPSHHFPTGRITPISRRYELLGWASEKKDRYIIEDDYDSEFRMIGKPIPALLNIDMSEKVIYMNTFSKTLAQTVRISYMVLPLSLAKRFKDEMSFYSCTVSNFEQYALAEFISAGYFEKHLNRVRNYYRKKRDLLLNKLKNSKLNPYIKIMEEDAGLHFIIEIKTNISDDEMCKKALQKGLKLAALSDYYYDKQLAIHHRFIINYSSISEEHMDFAIETLYEIIV